MCSAHPAPPRSSQTQFNHSQLLAWVCRQRRGLHAVRPHLPQRAAAAAGCLCHSAHHVEFCCAVVPGRVLLPGGLVKQLTQQAAEHAAALLLLLLRHRSRCCLC